MVKVVTTGKIFLFWIFFLVVMLTIFYYQWINGTTESARLGGEFYALLTVEGLVVSLIVLFADKKWRFW